MAVVWKRTVLCTYSTPSPYQKKTDIGGTYPSCPCVTSFLILPHKTALTSRICSVVHVFRITFKGVKLDLALTEQGNSKSNSKNAHIQYIIIHFIQNYTLIRPNTDLKHLIETNPSLNAASWLKLSVSLRIWFNIISCFSKQHVPFWCIDSC